jgi:hypothetical protein
MPNQLLERVDFTEPGIWLFFLTVLVLVIYWYFHESAELRREYARFYRELAKEKFFGVDPTGWNEKFGRATVLFDGGGWFAAAWAILLVLACGLVFLHGAQNDNIRRAIAFVATEDDAKQLREDLSARMPPEMFKRCEVHLATNASQVLRAIGAKVVLRDVPKQGDSLLANIEALWPGHSGFEAIRPSFQRDVELLNYSYAPVELSRRKADFVLEQSVDQVFRVRTACINGEGRTLEVNRNTIIACIYSGSQRRATQQGIGVLYLFFAVLMVVGIKGKKSAAFALMQRFSALAMQQAAKAHIASATLAIVPPITPPITPPVVPPATLLATPPVTPAVPPPVELPVELPVTPLVEPPVAAPVAPPVEPPAEPPVTSPVTPPLSTPVTPQPNSPTPATHKGGKGKRKRR